MSEKKTEPEIDNFSVAIAELNDAISAKNLQLPKNQQVPLIVTGLEAEKESGIQHEFAAHILLATFSFQTALSVRAGSSPDFDNIRAPKTGDIRSQTSDHGLGTGLIPTETLFTRLDSNRQPKGLHEADLKKIQGSQPLTQLNLSLRSIIEKTQPKPLGDLEIVKYNKEKDELTLRYQKGCGPKDFKGEFVLTNFLRSKKKSPPQHFARPWNAPDLKSMDAMIKGLNKKLKLNLSEHMDVEYPIYYRKETSGKDIQPFMVFSDKNGVPITGDWDLMMVGHPPQFQASKQDYACQVHSTFKDYASKEALLLEFDNLFVYLRNEALQKLTKILKETKESKQEIKDPKEINDFLEQVQKQLNVSELKETKERKETKEFKGSKEISNFQLKMNAFLTLQPVDQLLLLTQESTQLYDAFALDRAGSITPFEFLLSRLLNIAYGSEVSVFGAQTEFGKKNPFFDPNVKNLIQHGSENRNPYASSNLNTKMLHFYNGTIYLTRGEKQLIQFYLANDFLKNNLVDVHPKWQMSEWAPVLEKQQALGQIDLTHVKNNKRAEQREVAQCYQDYQAMLKLEENRKKNSTFALSYQDSPILQRLLDNQQALPTGLTKALKAFDDQHRLSYQSGHKTPELHFVQPKTKEESKGASTQETKDKPHYGPHHPHTD